jgi:uncharacterized protein YndB with AHSA1/START domain
MNIMDKIKIEALVNAPVEKVWDTFNNPEHVTKWNHASDDWHSPRAENDLRVGGKFNYRMEAKDGSGGFDFEGVYTEVVLNEKISYEMSDGRKVDVVFENLGEQTKIATAFDPEAQNPAEFQKQGWQAILDNFKKYTESI